jgi:hypothetical protein
VKHNQSANAKGVKAGSRSKGAFRVSCFQFYKLACEQMQRKLLADGSEAAGTPANGLRAYEA